MTIDGRAGEEVTGASLLEIGPGLAGAGLPQDLPVLAPQAWQ
ncbi:hypothetical protein amrb99_23380 [Actinomadura sp. RB99]|nr:hypothetical protein [Actinomadura sp. RB99]